MVVTDSEKEIDVSVIIPVYNDPDGIEVTLKSLVSQNFPDYRYEIIVVDNGSTDSTQSVIEKYKRRYSNLITFLTEDKISSSYAARNKGIWYAHGSVLAFIDADMDISSDWISLIKNTLEKNKWDLMGCNVENYIIDCTYISEYNYRYEFQIEKCIKDLGFSPTCCLVVRRNVIEKVGMFDSRLISSGDVRFGRKAREHGFMIKYAEDITMNHPARSTLLAFTKKQFRIGRGLSQLEQYYPSPYLHDSLFREFLPPDPTSQFSNDTYTTNAIQFLIFYLLLYYGNVICGSGRIYEWISNNYGKKFKL